MVEVPGFEPGCPINSPEEDYLEKGGKSEIAPINCQIIVRKCLTDPQQG
jgi:hypothetical protein